MQQQIPEQTSFSPESDHSNDSADYFSVSMVDGKKNYSCLTPNCGKVFKFKSEIKRHIIIHCKERPFECTFPGCKKSFKRVDALGNHIKLHERPNPYDCPIPGCKVQLNTKAGLQYHLSKHGEEEETYKCNFPGCNQSFLTYKHLSHHEKSTHFANASGLKRPQMMVPAPPVASYMDDGLEAFMMGNKKRAMQSYLASNTVKYEEESHSSFSDNKIKAEFNEGLMQPAFMRSHSLTQPALIQPPTSNFEDNIKSALMSTLAENQKLKKDLELSMQFLQSNLINNQMRNQTYIPSAYKGLMEPVSI